MNTITRLVSQLGMFLLLMHCHLHQHVFCWLSFLTLLINLLINVLHNFRPDSLGLILYVCALLVLSVIFTVFFILCLFVISCLYLTFLFTLVKPFNRWMELLRLIPSWSKLMLLLFLQLLAIPKIPCSYECSISHWLHCLCFEQGDLWWLSS